MRIFGKNLFKLSQTLVIVASVSLLSACSQDTAVEKAVDVLDLDHEDVFSLGVGVCFDDENLAEEEVSSVPVRDCNEPHDNEIYFAFNLPDGEYPTTDKHMYAKCEEEFANFIGVKYNDSIYDYDIMSPTESSWEDNDREVLCFVYDDDGKKLEKSLKDAKK
ncbi:MAG: hypothetical protein CSA42_06390 [Gammaproteobacteria bacterium]|nr:MAG: hypothetical protein CSA42_06390 [Gammaproteobacteria bacterium]